ncbi:MAG: hypothetical protein GY795_49000 [Desulfobacterales bacterium]|nr:hypothetical protein [Desulfobacterales bacterium]
MTTVSKKKLIISAAAVIILFAASLSGAPAAEIGSKNILKANIYAPRGSSFSVFALNSIHMKSKTAVHNGDIGVMNRSQGQCLYRDAEIALESSVHFADGTAVYGDTVTMKHKASVYDIHYNKLDSRGTVAENETLNFQTAGL